MPLPRLRLAPLHAAPPLAPRFAGASPVLWLEPRATARHSLLDPVHLMLRAEGRLFSPALRVVPVAGPSPGRSPWAHRQDRQEPLRWGASDGLEGEAELASLHPGPFDGVVLSGACAALPDQALRSLLRQLAPLLRPSAPFVAVEPNGRSWLHIAAALRTPEEERGEGRSTIRAVEELRRLFETGGLGLEGVYALLAPGRRARWVARLLSPDGTAPHLLAMGRAIRGGEALR